MPVRGTLRRARPISATSKLTAMAAASPGATQAELLTGLLPLTSPPVDLPFPSRPGTTALQERMRADAT